MLGDEYCIGILGDLHIDPRKMEDFETGREQWMPIFDEGKEQHGNVAMASLGDLGESKSVRPKETSELFARTTECHTIAADFLGSFNVPCEVVWGNHHFEGLDEIETDKENLAMFLDKHGKPTPQFVREMAEIPSSATWRLPSSATPSTHPMRSPWTTCRWRGSRTCLWSARPQTGGRSSPSPTPLPTGWDFASFRRITQ